MELNGKVAWVVGASSGIGAAVARELARRGGTVAISARRDEQLQEVSGGHMLVVPLDVTDAASVAAAAARVHEELGPIDLAVLSAGYWKQMDPQDWDTEVFDQHIRVNLAGMSNAIAAVLPGMLRRHHGVIAGIASVAGYRGLAGSEAYGATKAAQINLLESLRVHVARTGVHVTTICPGFVRTDLTAGTQAVAAHPGTPGTGDGAARAHRPLWCRPGRPHLPLRARQPRSRRQHGGRYGRKSGPPHSAPGSSLVRS